jgi:hypothetical protein
MKKPYRQADGFYHVDGKKYKTLFGSREQVMNGTVHKTTGGLTKANLVMNKWGRIVSAKKFKTAKKEMRLQKHGFFAKKGKFGAITRKFRGGQDAAAPTDDAAAAVAAAEEKRKQDEAANKITNIAPVNIIPAASPAASPAPAPTDSASTDPASTAPAPAPAPDSASKTGGANKKTRSPPRDEAGNIIYKQKSNKKKSSSTSEENKNKNK